MKHTALLVEDCEDSRFVFRKMLETLGFRVIAAGDAEEATTMSHHLPEGVDLLLTDIKLPGMDGRELADLLSKAYSGLRVILMSGYPAKELATDGRPFLQKPFTLAQAARVIKQTMSERAVTEVTGESDPLAQAVE